LRIVAVDQVSADGGARRSARAVADPSATLEGRGAYLCLGTTAGQPAAKCLELATRRNGISRALRRSISDRSVALDSKLVESVSP
jgi:predicted RNA-binding protein YlxR (DUF448 family)